MLKAYAAPASPAQSAPPAGSADKAEVAVAAAHEVCDEMCSDTMYSEIGTDGMRAFCCYQ